MTRIFISYRREDTAADMTDRIYERLVQRWGRRVFMDIDSLVGGDLFAKAIEENLDHCAVMLVVIGRHWVSLSDEHGARRIDSPGDYPRMEVAAALRRGIRVVPVLVGNAPLPRAEELPADVRGLLDRQVVRLSRERFEADVRQLLDAVAHEMPGSGRRATAAKWLGAATALVALFLGVAWYLAGTAEETSVSKSDATREAKPDAPTAVTAALPTAPPPAQAASLAGAAAVQPKPSLGGLPRPAAGASRQDVAAAPPSVSPNTADTAARPHVAQVRPRSGSAARSTSVTGDWVSTPITNAYAGNHRFILRFELVQKADTVMGTVFQADVGDDVGYSRDIFDGRIDGDVISFHTKGEMTGGPNGTLVPYKQRYVGTMQAGTRQIEFRRHNDMGNRIERFTVMPKP